MKILGIRYGHSAAAALIIDGEIVANVMEERFTRIKNDGSFPEKAITWCLEYAGISSEDLDFIAFPNLEVPLPAFSFFQQKEHYTIEYFVPKRAIKLETLFVEQVQRKGIPRLPVYIKPWQIKPNCRFVCVEHHLGHAASAYYTSGFEGESLIFTLDGRGDNVSTAIWKGHENEIENLRRWDGSSSLAWFYSAVTEALNWRHGSDEWKVMGLAPYGSVQPGILNDLHPVFKKGELKHGFPFGEADRWPDHGTNHYHFEAASLIKKKVDEFGRETIAAETQRIAEEQLFDLVLPWIEKSGIRQVAFAGGFFLNVKANQKLWYTGELEKQWVYPDPGDSGLPVGVALFVYHNSNDQEPKRLSTLYHGPEFADEEIEIILKDRGIRYTKPESIESSTADLLADGKIVGWFQGRMEAGPRALGNRSILMNPCDPNAKDIINEKVKFREPFRPFCPSMLHESKDDYLVNARDEFFMVTSFDAKEEKKEQIPAVIHVDGTARPQMVTKQMNPRYYTLIQELAKRTGHPVVLNTSFNVKGEPIVSHPREAIKCFYDNGLDVLVLGSFLITK